MRAMGRKIGGVPKESEVPEITSPVLTFLSDNMTWIRLALLVTAMVFFRILSAWFAESRDNFHKIRKDMDRMNRSHEQEEEK